MRPETIRETLAPGGRPESSAFPIRRTRLPRSRGPRGPRLPYYSTTPSNQVKSGTFMEKKDLEDDSDSSSSDDETDLKVK